MLYHLSKESKKGTVPRGLQAILTATCVRTHSSDEAYEELKNYFGENFLPKGYAFFMDLAAESPEILAQARPLLYEINHDSGAEFGRYEDSPDFEYLSLSRPPRPVRVTKIITTKPSVPKRLVCPREKPKERPRLFLSEEERIAEIATRLGVRE